SLVSLPESTEIGLKNAPALLSTTQLVTKNACGVGKRLGVISAFVQQSRFRQGLIGTGKEDGAMLNLSTGSAVSEMQGAKVWQVGPRQHQVCCHLSGPIVSADRGIVQII